MVDDLISAIYDCAIDPARWQSTLQLICDYAGFQLGFTHLLDYRAGLLIHESAGFPPSLQAQYMAHKQAYDAEIEDLRSRFFAPLSIEEPQIWTRIMPREAYAGTRGFTECWKPHGIVDFMRLVLIQGENYHGGVSFARHEAQGAFDDTSIAFGSMLLPHLRRAMTISKLLEVQTLQTNNLRTLLHSLSTGVILVTKDGIIVEANPSAARLLEDGRIIHAINGSLAASDWYQTGLLHDAIARAAGGANGSGMSLQGVGLAPVFAHILPLASGNLRPNLRQDAVAGIFLSPSDDDHGKLPQAAILGTTYNLTEAETRVAGAVADGKTSLDAAEMLGISENTIRSHLKRIFAKTGVTRQAELISLMNRLAVPVRSSAGVTRG